MELVFASDEIKIAAKKFLDYVNDYKIFALHGEMGAGKTTFIGEICGESGVKTNVSSPTFSIIHEYKSAKGIIYHIDLYRIKDMEEAIQAGVEECIYSGYHCFIEWPEKIFSILPLNSVQVFLEIIDQNKRKLIIKIP